MPHGSIRVGEVEIVALCDAVVESSGTIEESYPRVPDETWPELKERYPASVAPSGHWRLHVHAFLLRAGARTILFDTGIGPESAPAFAWARTGGSLPAELAAAGIAGDDVDEVVISHVHDDHVGWNVGGTEPRFPRARYLVHGDDLEAVQSSPDEEHRAIWRQTLEPLAGAISPSADGEDLGDGLVLLNLPGHTPGHQVLLVESNGERAVLSADLTNHPLLLENPEWSGISDADPDEAARTRAGFLDRVERESLLYIPSHFEQPFGTLEPSRSGWRHAPSG